MANTLDFTALEEYVNIHRDELLVKASLGTKSINFDKRFYSVFNAVVEINKN